MSGGQGSPAGPHPRQGPVVYLQLPAVDIAASATFYEAVFGWSVDSDRGRFEAPGIIGEWTTDRPPAGNAGRWCGSSPSNFGPSSSGSKQMAGMSGGDPSRTAVSATSSSATTPPATALAWPSPSAAAPSPRRLSRCAMWRHPAGGISTCSGCAATTAGPTYERLVDGNTLVLQLHAFASDHHHGTIGDPERELGNGVVLWFGETADFDGAVARAEELGATVVLSPLRNPSEGEGNGPSHRRYGSRTSTATPSSLPVPTARRSKPSSAGADAPRPRPDIDDRAISPDGVGQVLGS